MKQGTQEWLNMRKKYIGASDAPAIMGVSPYKTKLDLWKEKIGQSEQQETKPWMQAGLDAEPRIRDWYILQTDLGFEPEVIFHTEIPYMMASLDGISEDRTKIIEIKNASEKDHEIARSGRVPDKYYPQLQHQIIVAESVSNINLNVPSVTYLSHRNGEILSVDVKKNIDYCLDLLLEERLFWEGLMNKIPPLEEEPEEEIKILVNQLKSLRKKEIEMNIEIEKTKKSLTDKLKDKNFSWDGVQISKVIRKGSINYKNIPELNAIDVEKYRGPETKFWKISIGI